jgi:gliding motility-associated-like protein
MNVYSVTVTDDAGCQKTGTVKVRVDSVAATIAYTPASCFGRTDGSATVTMTSGIRPYTYAWSTVPVQTTSVATALAIATYSVAITDSAGCKNTQSTTITQPPPLTMSIGGTTDPDSCGGHGGTIILNGLTPTTGYTVRYLYTATATTTTVATVGTYTTTATGSITIGGLAQGTYDSIAIVTAGCPYDTLGPLILRDPPPPAIPYVTSNSPICVTSTLNLSTTDVTPGVLYSWSGPNAFNNTTQTPSITPSVFADSGWYYVTVQVKNCFSKDSTHVIIVDTTHPAAANNSQICSGDTLKLFGTVLSGGATSYIWNGPNAFSSNFQNPVIPNAGAVASGTYTVIVTYQGCSAQAITVATVNPTPDPPLVVDTNYCQFTNPVPPLSVTGTNILWYTSATSTFSYSVAPVPTTDVPGITTWYVTQTSNTAPPCVSQRAPQTVGVYAFPTPNFVVTDSVFCVGTYFTFNVTGANSGADFQGITWSFSGAGDSVQNVNPLLHAFNDTGVSSITAHVYYRVCPDTVFSHPIHVYPYPILHLGQDTSICPGSEAIIIGDHENTSTPGASWWWNTGETTPTIRIVAPGTFYEKVSINGCNTTDTIVVQNDCYMNLPNVFSPNGDGVNDYFFPRQYLTRGLISFRMDIYNRWGQVVFTTNSLDGRGWDGKFNDVPQPEGVFVYVIDAVFKDGQKEHHQGNITLLR